MKANTECFPRLYLMINMKVNLSNNLNGSRFTWHPYWFDLSILDLLTMKLIKCEVYSLFSGIQYSTKTFSIDVFEKKKNSKYIITVILDVMVIRKIASFLLLQEVNN